MPWAALGGQPLPPACRGMWVPGAAAWHQPRAKGGLQEVGLGLSRPVPEGQGQGRGGRGGCEPEAAARMWAEGPVSLWGRVGPAGQETGVSSSLGVSESGACPLCAGAGSQGGSGLPGREAGDLSSASDAPIPRGSLQGTLGPEGKEGGLRLSRDLWPRVKRWPWSWASNQGGVRWPGVGGGSQGGGLLVAVGTFAFPSF